MQTAKETKFDLITILIFKEFDFLFHVYFRLTSIMICEPVHVILRYVKTPNGKWVRVKRRWGIYILNFFKRDLFVFLSEKYRGLNDVQ